MVEVYGVPWINEEERDREACAFVQRLEEKHNRLLIPLYVGATT